MILLHKIPQDCSAEKLFPDAQKIIDSHKPYGYCINHNGHTLETKIPYWDVEYDPLEENKIVNGEIEHDYWIVLCKWMDGTPITFRYKVSDVIPFPNAEGLYYDKYLARLYNINKDW